MANYTNIPKHIAIIMDGNGRWARAKGLDRLEGHFRGVESVRESIKAALRHGVAYLTLYVFSTENWGRPSPEVEGLMELFCRCVSDETESLREQGVSVRAIGSLDQLSEKVYENLRHIEQGTAGGDKLTLVLAFNYSSRMEITDAVRKIAAKTAGGELSAEDITPELIASNLYTCGIPDPDLLIRTGGDCRLSNFLLWQSSYSELWFTDTFWPDFDQAEFDRAIASYCTRERRFGLVNDEIHSQEAR